MHLSTADCAWLYPQAPIIPQRGSTPRTQWGTPILHTISACAYHKIIFKLWLGAGHSPNKLQKKIHVVSTRSFNCFLPDSWPMFQVSRTSCRTRRLLVSSGRICGWRIAWTDDYRCVCYVWAAPVCSLLAWSADIRRQSCLLCTCPTRKHSAVPACLSVCLFVCSFSSYSCSAM